MDFWTLLIVVWLDKQWAMIEDSTHKDMDACMARREEVVELLGRPIKDYQAVCVWHHNKETL